LGISDRIKLLKKLLSKPSKLHPVNPENLKGVTKTCVQLGLLANAVMVLEVAKWLCNYACSLPM